MTDVLVSYAHVENGDVRPIVQTRVQASVQTIVRASAQAIVRALAQLLTTNLRQLGIAGGNRWTPREGSRAEADDTLPRDRGEVWLPPRALAPTPN